MENVAVAMAEVISLPDHSEVQMPRQPVSHTEPDKQVEMSIMTDALPSNVGSSTPCDKESMVIAPDCNDVIANTPSVQTSAIKSDAKFNITSNHMQGANPFSRENLQECSEAITKSGEESMDTSESAQSIAEPREVTLTITDVRSLENDQCHTEDVLEASTVCESDVPGVGADLFEGESDKAADVNENVSEDVDKNDLHETVDTGTDSSVLVRAKETEDHVNDIRKQDDETVHENEELLMITDVRSLSEEKSNESEDVNDSKQLETEHEILESCKANELSNDNANGKQTVQSGDLNKDIKGGPDQQSKQLHMTQLSVNERATDVNGPTHLPTANFEMCDSNIVSVDQTISATVDKENLYENGLPVIVPGSCLTVTTPSMPSSEAKEISVENDLPVIVPGSCQTVTTSALPSVAKEISVENDLPAILPGSCQTVAVSAVPPTETEELSVQNNLPVILPGSCQTITTSPLHTSASSSNETCNPIGLGLDSVMEPTSISLVSLPSVSPENNSFPVISSVFSIKQEPTDDGSYGAMLPNVSTSGALTTVNRASISSVINKLHSQQAKQPATALKTKTLNLSCIHGINTAVSQMHKTSPNQPMISGASNVRTIQYVIPSGIQTLQSTSKKKVIQLTTVDGKQKRVIPIPSEQRNQLPACNNNTQQVKILCTPKQVTTDLNSKQKSLLPRSRSVTVLPARPAKPTYTVISTRPVPVSNTKPAAQTLKKTEDIETEDSSNFINIQTVGIGRITDLISRKNPIPMFKPMHMPQELCSKETVGRKTYPCFECGDTFYFEKSLKIHLNRCSMRLTYKCTKCEAQLQFTNKCQLLGHLRSHLDIKSTDAVPIHIKSDSIQIKTVYDEIGDGKNFEWFDVQKSESVENSEKCSVCHEVFMDKTQRTKHFSTFNKGGPFKCDICYICLPNECSLKLHSNLHRMVIDNLVTGDLICPECGQYFPQKEQARFCGHMELECFHTYRVWVWTCPKCKETCKSEDEVHIHMLACLENYYKCTDCPMALKYLRSFLQHYRQKHDPSNTDPKEHVKLIYRCHLCDTLIDDRGFLISHVRKHAMSYKQSGKFAYSCRTCGAMIDSVAEMNSHFNKDHSMHRFALFPRECIICRKSFVSAVEAFLHNMTHHREKSNKVVTQFCKCGLVCTSREMLSEHPCHLRTLKDDKQSKVRNASKKTDSDEAPYQCPLCLFCYRSNANRIGHIQQHRRRKEYICISCDRIDFIDYTTLRNHEIFCVESKKMADKNNVSIKAECTQTRKKVVTPSRKRMKSNKIKDKTAGMNTSRSTDDSGDSDGEKAENFGKVRLNLKGVTQESRFIDIGETYKCDRCSKTFTRMSKLRDHKDAEHGLHSCHLCGMLYESQSKLKMHLFVNHKGMKPVYYCWICRTRKMEKCYTEKSFLERHLRQKHRMKVWDKSKIVAEWPDTELKGVSPEPQVLDSLNECRNTEVEPPVKKLKVEGECEFKCAKCVFTCESKEKFHEHIAGHRTEDTVQCLECGLCFTVMPSLQRHLFMVHKLRDFGSYVKENCIEAPKELESLDFIEKEETIHESSEETSEEEAGNPLECKVCYKEFDTEHGLKKHMRVHGMAFIKKTKRRKAVNNTTSKTHKEIEIDVVNVVNDVDVVKKSKNELNENNEVPCKKFRLESFPSVDGQDHTENREDKEKGQKESLKIKLTFSDKTENGEKTAEWEVKELS